jgi:hypothetical protein
MSGRVRALVGAGVVAVAVAWSLGDGPPARGEEADAAPRRPRQPSPTCWS